MPDDDQESEDEDEDNESGERETESEDEAQANEPDQVQDDRVQKRRTTDMRPVERVEGELHLPTPRVEQRPDPAKRRSQPERRHRGLEIASNAIAHIPVPELSISVEQLYPRGRTFSITGRFGAGYGAVNETGLWNVGLGFSYALDPRISFDLRGDFQMPMDEQGIATGLSSVWLSLNMLWHLNIRGWIQPYLIAGVLLAIAPGNDNLGTEGVVAGGGQGGVGLEILIRRVFGISFEAVGYVAGHESALLEGGFAATTALSWYI